MEHDSTTRALETAAAAAHQCAQALAQLRQRAAQGGPPFEALPSGEIHEKMHVRQSLLLRKHCLKKSMEDVRAEMRCLQSECEGYSQQGRVTQVLQASTEAVIAAKRDEFDKVHTQLARARQQIAEHSCAQAALKVQLAQRSESLKDTISAGKELCQNAGVEAFEMRRLCREMRARICTKGQEVRQCEQTYTDALAERAAVEEHWRREFSLRIVDLCEETQVETHLGVISRMAKSVCNAHNFQHAARDREVGRNAQVTEKTTGKTKLLLEKLFVEYCPTSTVAVSPRDRSRCVLCFF